MYQASVSRHIVSVKSSSWNMICFWQKGYSKTTRSRFILSLHHCSVSWKITPLYCFSSNLICFRQKDLMEVKFSNFRVLVWEFIKSFMSYLKPPVRFRLDFALLFSVMRDMLSVLFHLKLYVVWAKGAHECTQFQIFDCSRETSLNLNSDKLLLLKVYKMSAKKVQRSYVSWYWRVMQNLK